MNNSGLVEEKALKDVLSGFIGSYAERDKSIAFSDWLEDRLRQEMPDMPKETSEKLAGEIIGAVADYDKTLGELNLAVEAGDSKEEWFAERMAENYADMPIEVVGEKLLQIENTFTASNAQLMQEPVQIGEESSVNADLIEWNEYSLKNKVYEIGKQASLAGLAATANALKDSAQRSETEDIGNVVGEALQNGLKAASGEVKATVAGAVKVAAVKGLAHMLPANTTTETICDMAGVAVEGAEALFDVVTEKSTMLEALDKIGKSTVAASCRFGAVALKGALIAVPYGPVVVTVLGGLIDHVASPKFRENIYTVVHDAAVATWKGIKETGKKILHGLANFKNIFAD